MYGWDSRPEKLESRMTENGAAVYECGSYDVLIHPDGAVTRRHKYRQETDPKRALPNMEILDGEIRIQITDLVGEILKRLEPADLARALWSNEECRAAFIERFVNRFSSSDFSDAERRDALRDIKEAIHDRALDRLNSRLSDMEWALSQHHHFHSQCERANRALEARGVEFRFDDGWHDPLIKVGGQAWEDARNYWRATVNTSFPGPAALRASPAIADEEKV